MNPDTNFKIYVACHRPYDYLKKIEQMPYFTLIHGGKAIYDPEMYQFSRYSYLPDFGDDTGDNISWKNEYYCELTVLYWIWKNDKSRPDDVVGLCHYRRYFGHRVYDFMTKERALEILDKYDYIVIGASIELSDLVQEEVPHEEHDIGEYSVYRGYRDCHRIEDMDCALKGIKILFPELYHKMNYEIMQNGAMSICNMMITKKKYLDEYCEFLFKLYDWMEQELNFEEIMAENRNCRFFGYLSERLQRPWMIATKHTAYSCVELDWQTYSGYTWQD